MKEAKLALLTFLMMGLSTANACEDHEGMTKEKSEPATVAAPNPK